MKILLGVVAFLIAVPVSVPASPLQRMQQARCETTSHPAQYIRLEPGSDYATSVHALDPKLKAIFVSTPWPDYPFFARMQRLTGSGVARIYVNEQGKVTSLKLLKSTGHRDLDEEGAGAFRRWRTTPGQPREIDIPFTFTMSQ